MDERMRQAGQFAQDAIRGAAQQTLREHGDYKYERGFSAAAGITLRLIDAKLEAFKEQMKSAGLSKSDQLIYAQLDELKSEIEAECDRYWRDTGVDWRPLKPVVRGVIRRTTEEPRE